MSKICAASGKKVSFGRSIQHKSAGKWRYRAPKTNRPFKANIRSVKVLDEKKNVHKINLSMKAYKKLRKEGFIKIPTENGEIKYFLYPVAVKAATSTK